MSNQEGLSIFDDDEPAAGSASAEKRQAAEPADAEKTQVIPVLDDARRAGAAARREPTRPRTTRRR